MSETYDTFCQRIENTIPELMDRFGSSLYSPPRTLGRGDLLILGTNPGIGGSGMTLRENLEFRRKHPDFHSYCESIRGTVTPLMKRLRWLTAQLGLELREVCAINLMFTPTSNAAASLYPDEAWRCWPIHEWIIQTVRPRLILAFGNSASSSYEFIRKHVLNDNIVENPHIDSGHGNWRCRSFAAELAGVALTVVGVPHLSRYDPHGKTALVRLCQEALAKEVSSIPLN